MSCESENECQFRKQFQETDLHEKIENLSAMVKDLADKLENAQNTMRETEEKTANNGSKSRLPLVDTVTAMGNTMSKVLPKALKYKNGLPALLVCGGLWVVSHTVTTLNNIATSAPTAYLVQTFTFLLGIAMAILILVCFPLWVVKDPDRPPEPPGNSMPSDKKTDSQLKDKKNNIDKEKDDNMPTSIKNHRFLSYKLSEDHSSERELFLEDIINLLEDLYKTLIKILDETDHDHFTTVVKQELIFMIIQKRKSVLKLKVEITYLKSSGNLYPLSIYYEPEISKIPIEQTANIPVTNIAYSFSHLNAESRPIDCREQVALLWPSLRTDLN